MTPLLAHIDTLLAHAKSLSSTSLSVLPSTPDAPRPGPFTRAALHVPRNLASLIRDADASELGLFVLAAGPTPTPAPAPAPASKPPQGLGRPAQTHKPKHAAAAVDGPPDGRTDEPTLLRASWAGATPLRRERQYQRGLYHDQRRHADTARPSASRGTRTASTSKTAPADPPQEPPDQDPEVYAHAALRYLDRFAAVKPMPRARARATHVLAQLSDARARVLELTEALHQLADARAPASPRSAAQEEERKIAALQRRLQAAKDRKAAAQTKKRTRHSRLSVGLLSPSVSASTNAISPPPRGITTTTTNTDPSTPGGLARTPTRAPHTPHMRTPPALSASASTSQFWTTPAQAGRALRYSAVGAAGGSLLDEQWEGLGPGAGAGPDADVDPDVSVAGSGEPGEDEGEGEGSLGSLVSVSVPTTWERIGMGRSGVDGADRDGVGGTSRAREVDDDDEDDEDKDEDGEDEEDAEKTVVRPLCSPPLTPTPSPAPNPAPSVVEEVVELEPAQPMTTVAEKGKGGEEKAKPKPRARKIRITPEVERVVARVWATVGEVIMPGHPFDVRGEGGTRPPRAAETIAHLQTLARSAATATAPATPPSSPGGASAVSSTASPARAAPGAQAVCMAHVILHLLSSPAPPQTHTETQAQGLRRPLHRAPLKAVKDVLVHVGGPSAGRVVYACVAKCLVRIERGGGEQVVVFDV